MNVLHKLVLLLIFIGGKAWCQRPVDNPPEYVEKVISHYNKQLSKGLDVYGDDTTSFWMASLNTYTGMYPEDATRPAHIPQRAYLDRYVDAPRGATLYWDMPSIVAAYALSKLTGDAWYKKKAEAYTEDFLFHCVAKNGVFLWGNHYYYDAFVDSTMKFGSRPVAIDLKKEEGNLHEIRPIIPAWEVFWEIAPEATEKEIRVSTKAHLSNEATGEFNRHADGKRQHAFIEAGGSLIYSLAWLYSKTSDPALLQRADRIATYSFEHRNASTGLMVNNPTSDRWDSYSSTTEVGLWAACLLQAAQMTDETYQSKWINMADEALSSWLKYFAQLRRENGRCFLPWSGRKNCQRSHRCFVRP